jgi:hypothetical protein
MTDPIPPQRDGEIRTSASLDGRALTLDPVMPVIPIHVEPRRVESSMPAGFRVGWMHGGALTGEHADSTFSLTAGAGVGTPWLVLTIKNADGTYFGEEVIDMTDVVTAWIEKMITQGPTPAKETGE